MLLPNYHANANRANQLRTSMPRLAFFSGTEIVRSCRASIFKPCNQCDCEEPNNPFEHRLFLERVHVLNGCIQKIIVATTNQSTQQNE